jgi:NAD(P)H-quinone oxidoreductase subunit 5
MLTRVSIKVRLAWSTCAQMGFMLMEIGLGLYALALLHLVAHSLYKAHAFLFSGDTVNHVRRNSLLAPAGAARSMFRYLAAVPVSAGLVALSLLVWQSFLPAMSIPAVALFILVLGLSSLIWSEHGTAARPLLQALLSALLLIQLYMIWHLLFAELVPETEQGVGPLAVWVTVCFGGFYLCQAWLRLHPQGRFSRAVYPWVYAGFYLDETFTRLTFRIWPVRFSPAQAQTLTNRYAIPKGNMP